MEIKTTSQIITEWNKLLLVGRNSLTGQSRKDFIKDVNNAKWVRVDDIIKVLDDGFGVENNLPTIKPLILLKFYKELTGKELK